MTNMQVFFFGLGVSFKKTPTHNDPMGPFPTKSGGILRGNPPTVTDGCWVLKRSSLPALCFVRIYLEDSSQSYGIESWVV